MLFSPDALTQAEDAHAARKAAPDAPGRDETAQEFFARFSTPPTPFLDKLERFAADWRAIEAEEQAKTERKWDALTDDYWAARSADSDDGEEVEA